MKTPIDILREARELVARPGGWTQGAFGRTETGLRLEVYELEKAASCCAMGALWKFTGGSWPFNEALKKLALLVDGADASSLYVYRAQFYNDAAGRTQAEVVAWFDRAIAREEARAETAP